MELEYVSINSGYVEKISSEEILNNLSQIADNDKICTNCGNKLPDIVSICPNCGTDKE